MFFIVSDKIEGSGNGHFAQVGLRGSMDSPLIFLLPKLHEDILCDILTFVFVFHIAIDHLTDKTIVFRKELFYKMHVRFWASTQKSLNPFNSPLHLHNNI